MRIFGVDPGVTTGWALIEVVDGGTWRLVGRGESRPVLETRGAELLALDEDLDRACDGAADVVMEEMLSHRITSADEKIEAQTVVKILTALTVRTLTTYAPTTVRSAVMGSGRATPAEIKATLRYLLRMGKKSKKGEAFTDHQADAVAVALCHALRSGALSVLDRCEDGRV